MEAIETQHETTTDIEPAAPDKYDAAVEYLTAHPNEIYTAWTRPERHVAGCLFQYVGPDENSYYMNRPCGCLTQIRGDGMVGYTPELTQLIRADERIPCSWTDVTPDDLPVFAGWQRRIDRILNRT